MATLQHNMDTLLQSDEFRDKMKRIPTHLKGVFIKAVEDLYDRESEKMLQLIWESRQEMRETFLTMEGEQKDLRCQSRMFEERRKDAERDIKGRKSRNGRTSSRMSTSSDITSTRRPLQNGSAYNRRQMGYETQDIRDLELPETSGARASSAGISHRSAPTPVFVKSIEELRDELFKHLSTAETKVESERERQKELLEWLKAEKRNKKQEKVEKANELLEEVSHMEMIKAKDKERQEQRLKERLEEKKKLKEGRESSLPPVESVQLETIVQIEPEPRGIEAISTDLGKEKKEKRKKKKHKQKDDEESQIGEENGEERKEKREKKKKHKRKDEDSEERVEIENEEAGREKRKEKKKHRHREAENGEEIDNGELERDKKEKKKKHRHRKESAVDELNEEEEREESERKEKKKEKRRIRREKRLQEEEDPDD